MKKLIYVLIALVVLGGAAFALTQTDLLKGDVEQLVKQQEMDVAENLIDLDTDDDGLPDSLEADLHTDPNNADTDGDGLPDGLEVKTLKTDPLLSDTDGGGVDDKTEKDNGTDPLDGSDDTAEAEPAPGGQAPVEEDPTGNYGTVEIEALDYGDNFISGLSKDNFTATSTGTSINAIQSVTEAGSVYKVEIPLNVTYTVTVSVDGYVDSQINQVKASVSSTNSYSVKMLPGYIVGVGSDTGTAITNATVQAGYGSGSMVDCELLSDVGLYGCLVIPKGTDSGAKYSASASGYESVQGEFLKTRSTNKDATVTNTVTLTTSGSTKQTELQEVNKLLDLKIDSVTYDKTSSTLTADVCLDGTLDAKITDVTTYYSVSAEGTAVSTHKDIVIAAADLTPDSCTKIEIEDTALATVTASTMDITMTIDAGKKITELDEQNNIYTGTLKNPAEIIELPDLAIESAYYDTTKSVFVTKVCLDGELPIPTEDITFYYIVKAGTTTLSEQKEKTIDPAELNSNACTNVELDASELAGTTEASMSLKMDIDAGEKIEEIDEKNNRYTGSIKGTPAEDVVTYSCSELDISPNSYTLTSSGTVSLTITSTLVSDQTSFLPHYLQALMINLASEESWTGTLMVTTTGTGTLTSSDGTTGTGSISITLTSDDLTETVSYTGAGADTLTAYIVGESACNDSLSLTAYTAPVTTTTTTTSTTDTGSSSSSDTDTSTYATGDELDKILTGEDTSCDDDYYIDVSLSDWYGLTAQFFHCAGIATGRTSIEFVGSGNTTKAEAIKMIMIISGNCESYNCEDEGDSLSTDFTDISGHWAESFLKVAEDLNVIRPTEGVKFNPDDPVKKGQVALWMARTAGKTLTSWEDDIPFPDTSVSSPYTYAIIIWYNTWVDSTRVYEGVNGYGEPDKYIPRSEAITLLERFYLSTYAK